MKFALLCLIIQSSFGFGGFKKVQMKNRFQSPARSFTMSANSFENLIKAMNKNVTKKEKMADLLKRLLRKTDLYLQ